VSFPPPPSSNATHALATAIVNYKPDWAKIALGQGADIFAKGPRGQGQTLLAEALILGLRAAKSREKSISGRMFADGQIKTAAVLLDYSRTQPIERFSLFDAVVARNIAAIHHNLEAARLAESDAGEYRKALALAVEQDDAEIVKLLLSVERFSLADAVNAQDLAAVRSAMRRGPLEDSNADEYHRCLVDAVRVDNSEIVELLLAAGMSPDTRIHVENDGRTELPLLTFAVHGWNQWPLLSFAAARDSTAAMQVLLRAGADPNAKPDARAQMHGVFLADGAYERALARAKAAADSARSAVEAAQGQPEADAAAQSLASAQALAAAMQATADARPGPALVEAQHNVDYAASITPLMVAATTSSLAAVKLLVEAGADLSAKDKKGRTALTYAKAAKFKRVVAYLQAAYEKRDAAGELSLAEAAATGTLYRVKALLDAGADVEQADEHGQTPLMFAVAAGHVEVVKMLCAAGANVHATRTADGGDLWTCAFGKPDAEIIGCLIEHGLDPNQTRKSGPALLLAFGLQKPAEILKLLLHNGADVNAPVPAEWIEKAKRKSQKSAEFLNVFGPRFKRGIHGKDELTSPGSVLEFAKHFASRDVYYLLHTHAGAAEQSHEFFYETVRDSLKKCAVLADDRFQAEAARIGAILDAKPLGWKRRKGVIHYMSSLGKALAAHYEQPEPGTGAQKVPLQLLQRLQAEVAAKGYTLVYTGLAQTSLQRLLLFPLNEPLAALAACGTNAANYGHDTRDVVNWCAETRREHPLTVIGAGFDFMDLGFAQPIQNSEKLAARIAEFCPDVQVSAQDPQAVGTFAEELTKAGRCFFWWD
jgi:ankyrin repeat protein